MGNKSPSAVLIDCAVVGDMNGCVNALKDGAATTSIGVAQQPMHVSAANGHVGIMRLLIQVPYFSQSAAPSPTLLSHITSFLTSPHCLTTSPPHCLTLTASLCLSFSYRLTLSTPLRDVSLVADLYSS